MAQAAAGDTPAGHIARPHEGSQANAFVADEIRKLADLHSSGVLTDEEFAARQLTVLSNPSQRATVPFHAVP
jgi:Short C-terminal domain